MNPGNMQNIANMANMTGFRATGQGPQQQQQQQQQGGMRRNDPRQQIQRAIYQALHEQDIPPGWQTTVAPQQRTMMVFQLVSSLRLIRPEMAIQKVIEVAMSFERKTFLECPDKAAYESQCHSKLVEITATRTNNVARLQQQMQDPRAAQMHLFQQQMALQNGMPMQMQGQLPQGFANLQGQHQLQSSPVPMHQQQIQQPQSGLMSNVMMNSQPMVPQNQPLLQNMPRQVPQNPVQHQFTAEENKQIMQMAQRNAQNTSKEEMEIIEQKLANIPMQQKKMWAQQGIEPLHFYFRQQAIKQFINGRTRMRERELAANQHMQVPMSQGTGFASQQSQPISRNPSNSQNQPFGAAPAPPNFDPSFTGNVQQNMHQILGLQKEALRSQELGQLVVPASNSQRHALQPQQQRGLPQATPQQQRANPSNVARPVPTPNSAQQQHLQAQQRQKEHIQAAQMQAAQAQNAKGAPNQVPQQTLQGQVGGLTNQLGQGPPQQSPAMPNLNRPLITSTPQPQSQSTPQPRQQPRPQDPSQKTDTYPNQQNPIHQQQQPQQQPTIPNGNMKTNPPQQARPIASLPEAMQQKLRELSDADKDKFLAKFQQRAQQQHLANARAAVQSGNVGNPVLNAQMGQQQPGQPQPMSRAMFAQPAGSNTSLQQGKSNPQQNVASLPNQMSVNLQGNPQQFQDMLQNPQITQNRAVQMAANSLNPEQARQMDRQNFPRGILNSQAVLQHMPDEIMTWSQLKTWVTENMHMMPLNIMEKLRGLQSIHYQQVLQQLRLQPSLNVNAIQTSVPVQQPGPAPQAQMLQVRTPQPPRTGPVNPQMSRLGHMPPVPPITLQDIHAARPRLPEHMKTLTDRELGTLIMQKRLKDQVARMEQNMNLQPMQYATLQQAQQQQEAQRQVQQMQASQSGPGQSQQGMNQASLAQQNARKLAGHNNMQGSTQVQQPRVVPQSTNQGQSTPKGLKRSSTDDVIEVPNPNVTHNQEQKTQNMSKQGNPKQKPNAPHSNQGQVAPVSQAQAPGSLYEAELRKQAAQGQATPLQKSAGGPKADIHTEPAHINVEEDSKKARLQHMMREVMQQSAARKPVPMDRHTRENMARKLNSQRSLISRMEGSLNSLYRVIDDEKKARNLTIARSLLIKQYRDRDFNLVDQFTITPEELESAIQTIVEIFRNIMGKVQEKNKQNAESGMQGVNSSQLPGVSKTHGAMAPLNAANLHQNQQVELQNLQAARQTSMQRNNSNRDNRAPAAPTSTQPPFTFGATSPSPHGIPQAYGPNGFTPDKLNLPPAKKRKGNQASSTATTPAQTLGTPVIDASPQLTKVPSPETRRQSATANRVRCPVADCAMSKRDFALTEDLAKHTSEAHKVKEPIIEDPLAWALESVRFGLGVTEDGKPKSGENGAKKEKTEQTSHEIKTSVSTQGLTPMKQEATTPMSRVSTQNGPQQAAGSNKDAISGARLSAANLSESNIGVVTSAANQPVTPPHDLWGDVAISPADLAACFPTLTDLQGSLSHDILTPSSTASSCKSDKNSPKQSDIGEDDLLKIRLETDSWIAPEFFQDTMFPQLDASLMDDELLGMDWEDAFGSTNVQAIGKDQNGRMKRNDGWPSQDFDASLFSIEL